MPLRSCLFALVALFALASAPQCAQTGAPPDSVLRSIAARVVDLDARRQWSTATPVTVDSLLAYYSDSVVYEHPSVGAIVRGKPELRRGMLQYIGSRPTTTPIVPRITMGPRVAVIEMPATPDPRAPNTPVPSTRRAFRVLEFDQRGLVRRIIDYPW